MNAPRIELEIVQGEEPWASTIIELEQKKAPATVENFLRYVDDGFFDGTIFHRVIPTFMIQGGGYTGPTAAKRTGLRKPIENEARNGLKNLPGASRRSPLGAPIPNAESLSAALPNPDRRTGRLCSCRSA